MPPARAGDVHALGQRRLGVGQVPQVALAVHDLGARRRTTRRRRPARSGWTRRGRCSCVRSASAVTRMRHRAVGGPSVGGRRPGSRRRWRGCRGRTRRRARRRATLPTKPTRPPERGQPGGGVGRRAARRLDGRRPCRRRGRCAVGSSISCIEPLTMPWSARKRLVGVGEHVDDGVADGDHVEGLAGTDLLGSTPPPGSRSGRTLLAHRLAATGASPGPARGSVRSRHLDPNPEQPVPDLTATPVHRRTDADPYRLPRTAVPSRYDLALEPDLTPFTFAGHVRHDARRGRGDRRRSCSTPSSSSCRPASVAGADGTVARRRGHRARRGDRAGHAALRARRWPPGRWTLAHRVHRHPQRQAARLLPLDLHRHRRRRPGHRHHPVRGHRRPPGLPVLGRARLQGRLRRHPRRRRRPGRRLERRRGRPRAPRRRQARGALRRHDDDVDLPGRLHRRPARRHRRRSTSTARRCASSTPAARATSPATPSRSASSACEFFTDYFGVPYPGDKLDLVAVPDFAFGAMENLGLRHLPRGAGAGRSRPRSTQPELQRVTDVIAHELAHMWFGDLVTMKWWNGIWLNEAFATFMEMLATDAFRPEWDRWSDFGLSRTMAFDIDALDTTRPIEFEVVSPDDAEGMFDVLTYEKGAAVVRMLEQYLGADAFREGIRHYLESHAYGNTETTDLWDAIESVTERAGAGDHGQLDLPGRLPARRPSTWSTTARSCGFGQERFGYAGDLGEGDPEAISALDAAALADPADLQPVGPRTSSPSRRCCSTRDGLDIAMVEPVDWVLVNTEATGFYRVGLRARAAGRAHRQGPDDLSPLERYGLVDDAWSAVLADRMHRGRLPRHGRGVRRRDRPVGLAAHRRRRWRRSTGWSTATPATRFQAGSTRWSARRSTASVASRTPTTATATASCAACCSRRSACWPTTTSTHDRARELLAQSDDRRRPARSTRACWPPPSPSSPRPATPTTSPPSSTGIKTRGHAAGGAPLPLRAVQLRRPRAVRRTCST